MDHWAPFLTGYQKHEKQSETESVWTLKGDVGVLARTLALPRAGDGVGGTRARDASR